MSQKQKTSKTVWAGRVMSFLAGAPFILSGAMKISMVPAVLDGFAKFGLPQTLLIPIGILELICVTLYFIPRLSVLGAILVTGYMGGAIITELRIGHPFIIESIIPMLAWGGLYLRDARLRELLPWVRPE